MPTPSAATTVRLAPPASLERRAGLLPLGRLVAGRPLVRLVPGAPPGMAFLHLQPDMAAMAAALGGAAPGDILRHLAEGTALRLLDALGEAEGAALPAQLRAAAVDKAPLLIDLPPRALAAGAVASSGWVASLPLHSAADPEAFATLAIAARRQGWGIALRGLTATSLAWLHPGAIAPDWFILDWSEALPDNALRSLDPERILLTGCDTDAALDWGLVRNIRIFGGAALDAWAARPGGDA
ncbi:MAG: hypothetical protein V4653_08960 [Pseudomonadota bacterium]